jgi:hypothetical protein
VSDFKPGEIVDIEIKGARVQGDDGPDSPQSLYVSVGAGVEIPIPLGEEGVTFTRVAPAEWPPQVDDLWRDTRGIVWFGRAPEYVKGPARLCMSDGSLWEVVAVNQEYGPLTLVHREAVATDA